MTEDIKTILKVFIHNILAKKRPVLQISLRGDDMAFSALVPEGKLL
jgi:hypothetical protein